MPLVELDVPLVRTTLPNEVNAFLREADRRIERFQVTGRVPAFVPGDYPSTFCVLRALSEADLAPGTLFCEWGSGFGVVTCLAAMLDFSAHGIEIEGELVEAARQLADDYELTVEFVRGSFIPPGAAELVGDPLRYSWLVTDEEDVSTEMGLGPDDFDVIFAYPWPDEARAVERIFEHFATPGAVLVTHQVSGEFRLQRKVRARRR